MNAMDFDDLLFRCVNLFELFPEVRDRYQHASSTCWSTSTRTLTTRSTAGCSSCRGAPEPGGGRRRRSVDLRLPRRRHPEHPRLRGRLPGRHRHQARAELPLHADDPRRRQRADRQQPHAEAQAPLDRRGQGDPVTVRELEDEHAEARFVAGEIERHVDGGGSRNDVAVFYRTNAQSRVLEDTLVRYGVGYQVIGGTRFYERAEIKDALGYLTLLVNPHDVVAFQRIVNSPRRGIGDTSQARIVGYANTIGEPILDVAATPEEIPGLGAAAVKAVGRFMDAMEKLRERAEAAPRSATCSRRRSPTPATSTRSRPSARSRPRAGSRTSRSWSAWRASTTRRPTSRRSRSSSSRSRSSPSRTGSRRRGHGHADDAAQRQGPRVPHRVHDRHGGRRVPAHRARSRRATSRRSAASATSAITRARRELYMTHARTRAIYGGREWNVPSRFLDEIPSELTDAARSRRARAVAGSWSEHRRPRAAPGGASRAAPRSRSATTWSTRCSATAS